MMSLYLGMFFIVLQGFFSGSETAAIMSDRLRILTWKRKRKKGTENVLFIMENLDSFIVSMLSFTNLCVVLSSTFITNFFVSRFGSWGTTFSIVFTIVFSLIVGEYLPKAYAQITRERALLLFSRIYRLLTYPFLFFSYIRRRRKSIYSVSTDEILSLLKEGERTGAVIDRGAGIAYKLLVSKDTPVVDVMTPLRMVKSVSMDWSRSRIKSYIRRFGFSRYPVYKGRKENIVGIINVKDVVYNSKRWIRKPVYINKDEKIFDAMKRLQRNRQMMGIVRKDGVCIGIVTMEDLLEEIVGEIRSEV